MSNHIPPDKLLPQDMVDLYDHGPAEEPFKEPQRMRMHASDAKHSMGVDPERYLLEPRRPVPKLIKPDWKEPTEDPNDGE